MKQIKRKMKKGLLALSIGLMACTAGMGSFLIRAEEPDSGSLLTSTVLGAGDVSNPQADLTQVPENGLGSIQIQLTEASEGRSWQGVQFEILQVADIQSGAYVLKESFAGLELDLNELQTAESLEQAAATLKKAAEELTGTEAYTVSTDSNGSASVQDLPVGAYLLYASDIADYELISPALLALPCWDETNECFLYDVEVEPKHSALPQIQVNKVDSETGINITNSAFEFTAYTDPDCKEKLISQQGDTDKGTATFTMTYGTIYIQESAAPVGYVLSDEVVKCEYDKEGVMKVNDEVIDPDSDYVYSIIYKNSLGSSSGPGILESVNTAVRQNPFIYMALFGAAGAGVILILAVKKEKKEQ